MSLLFVLFVASCVQTPKTFLIHEFCMSHSFVLRHLCPRVGFNLAPHNPQCGRICSSWKSHRRELKSHQDSFNVPRIIAFEICYVDDNTMMQSCFTMIDCNQMLVMLMITFRCNCVSP